MGFCSNCGNWVYSTDKTCPKCGKESGNKIEQKEDLFPPLASSDAHAPEADSVEQKEDLFPPLPPSRTVASPELESSAEEESDEDDDVPEVDEASLEKLDEEIIRIEDAESEENQKGSFSVCPNCGSPEIGLVPTSIDILDAQVKPTKYYCRNCGYEGMPFIINGADAVQTFIDSRNKALSKTAAPQPKPLYGISSSFGEKTSKKPYVAAFLSFLWPGVGQVYNGQAWKGLLCFVVAMVTLFFSTSLIHENNLGYLLFLVVYAGIILDAYINAKAANAE